MLSEPQTQSLPNPQHRVSPDHRDVLGMAAAELLQFAGDGIIVADEAGRILLFNAAAEEIFGYAAGEVDSQPIEILLPERLRRTHREQVRSFVTEKGPARRAMGQRRKVTGCRKDGHEFPVEVTLARRVIDGRTALVAVVRDVTERERERTNEQLLAHELGHRLKNVLATVQALARQSLRDRASPEDFTREFSGRIAALAEAHTLLIENSSQGVPLSDLVLRQLAPYRSAEHDNTFMGETVLLGPEATLAINLTLHELATNAAKFGAFSVPKGRVKVEWRVEVRPEGRHLVLEWAEFDGPSVRTPERRGFGSGLIEHVVAYREGGFARIEFPPDGVRCRLNLPLEDSDTGAQGHGDVR